MRNRFLFFLFVLCTIGCRQAFSVKVVETKTETSDCILGEWEQEVKSYKQGVAANVILIRNEEFGTTSENEGIFIIQGVDDKGNIVPDKHLIGRWKTKDIGEVELRKGSTVWKIKMINCSRFVLQKEAVHIKKRDQMEILKDPYYMNLLKKN